MKQGVKKEEKEEEKETEEDQDFSPGSSPTSYFMQNYNKLLKRTNSKKTVPTDSDETNKTTIVAQESKENAQSTPATPTNSTASISQELSTIEMSIQSTQTVERQIPDTNTNLASQPPVESTNSLPDSNSFYVHYMNNDFIAVNREIDLDPSGENAEEQAVASNQVELPRITRENVESHATYVEISNRVLFKCPKVNLNF